MTTDQQTLLTHIINQTGASTPADAVLVLGSVIQRWIAAVEAFNAMDFCNDPEDELIARELNCAEDILRMMVTL